MTRFYGVGDEPFGVEGAIDRIAELVGKVGIPQEKTVLELETQGATTKLPPEVWAQGGALLQREGLRLPLLGGRQRAVHPPRRQRLRHAG